MSPENQAKMAVGHVLQQIKENPSRLGWFAGFGSQSFALLTELYATLYGKPVSEVRKRFAPKDGRDLCEILLDALEAIDEGDRGLRHYAETNNLPDSEPATIARHAMKKFREVRQ